MWALIVLGHLANAALVPWVVGRGIYSPRVRIGDTARMAAVAALAGVDACLVLWLDPRLHAIACWALTFALAAVRVPPAHAQILTAALGRWRFGLYALSITLVSGLLYVHLPITTYLSSPEEFGIDLLDLTTRQMRTSIAFVYAAALFYALVVSPRMRSALASLAACVAVVAAIYAYVLPLGYPRMNGLTFERIPVATGELVLRSIADLLIVTAASVVTLRALIRWGGKRLVIGLAMANLSLVVSSVVNTTGHEASAALGTAAPPVDQGPQQPIRLARHKPNVLIIFLDRFMGGFVEQILEEEPGLARRLDGFAWYPKSVAAGENSIVGVHPIFGGYDYTPREMNARGKRLLDVATESYTILPHNFSRAGYQVNFVNPKGLGFTMVGDCGYLVMDGVRCRHVSPAVTKRLADQMGMEVNNDKLPASSYADLLVLLGGMRSVPYALKNALYHRGNWQPVVDHSAGSTFREWAELKALPTLTATDSPDSNLSIIMNVLPHEPYFMGEDCLPRTSRLTLSEDEVSTRKHKSLFGLQHAVATRCSLLLVADYLDFLKAEGVYDNTKIIVVSDHGIVGPVRDRSSRALRGGTSEGDFVRSRSVLLIKDEGRRGAMTISEEFMPNAEVPRIACEQIGGCVNPYLGNKTIEAHGRDEPFYVARTPWRFNRQRPNSFVIEKEVSLVNRDPYDAKGWRDVP